MIINSTMENLQQHINFECSENYYLKRKYDSINDINLISDGNNLSEHNNEICEQSSSSTSSFYIQSKKRHLLSFAINNENQLISTTTTTTTGIITPTTSITNENNSNCELTSYNLTNNTDDHHLNHSDVFTNDCQNMDFLNSYDHIGTLVSSVVSPTSSVVIHPVQNSVYISNPSSSSIVSDTNWQNSSDLLELDHRYNTIHLNNINDITTTTASSSMSTSATSTTTTEATTETHLNDNHYPNRQQATPNSSLQTDSDFEDKNLSWLFNFKLDELPHLSPEVNRSNPTNNNDNTNRNKSTSPLLISSSAASITASSASGITTTTINRNQSKLGKKVDELIMEATSSEFIENDINIGENVVIENNTTKTPKKPPFTYTELIEYALEDKGELTVSGIYQWISDRFPFYKSNDDRWKNSVRHNLSINPHFRKGIKAPQGAGHLWKIACRDSEENVLAWEHKKQRLELFFRMENSSQQKQSNGNNNDNNGTNNNLTETLSRESNSQYDEAATAAANIVQQLQNEDGNIRDLSPSNIEHNNSSSQIINTKNSVANNNQNISSSNFHHISSSPSSQHHHHHHQEHQHILTEIHDEDLQKAAGDILNGVRRDVEVQSLQSLHSSSDINSYHDHLLDNTGGDYLNPVNKYDAVAESGLRHNRNNCNNNNNNNGIDITNDYYVTEIDPIELGINMSNVEEEVLFSDEFNLNYFGINTNNDIVA